MLYRGAQLTLVEGSRAGNTRRDDLAIFTDKILQDFNVFIVHMLDAFRGETAEFFAFE